MNPQELSHTPEIKNIIRSDVQIRCDSWIIPKERNLVEYLDIKKAGNPNAYNREPFSKTEVAKLWDVKDSNIYYTVILMLIYTGCRIGELLDLKKEDVNLEG